MRLTVKGDALSAKHAAQRHGFGGAQVVRENLSGSTVLAVEDGEAPLALACVWFCELSTCATGVGYPAGTLLYYR